MVRHREWKDGALTVKIIERGPINIWSPNNINVIATFNDGNKKIEVQLKLSFQTLSDACKATFDELYGNGCGHTTPPKNMELQSPLKKKRASQLKVPFPGQAQRKGFGALLVNIGLQILQERMPSETVVKGQMSNINDPLDQELSKGCMGGRTKFWQSCGFTIIYTDEKGYPCDKGHERIDATLAILLEKLEARKQENKFVMGTYPRYISLKDFTDVKF